MNLSAPPFADPITTAGDLLVGGPGGVPTRLAAGALGQAVVSAGPATPLAYGAAGMVNPMTAVGDLITGGAAGAPTRLAAGATAAQALLSAGAGAVPRWGSPFSAEWLFYQPTGVLAETFTRMPHGSVTALTSAAASGKLWLNMIYLPAGLTIGHIAFVQASGSTNVPTNNWFGLYDNAFNQLALTADQGSLAWLGSSVRSLAIATIASGASSTFTTTYSGLHYLGFMITNSAGSFNSCGEANLTNGNPNTIAAVTPLISGSSDAAQTSPPGFPHTAATPATGASFQMYGYVAV